MNNLREIGWDPLVTGKYPDVLKPKISFGEVLHQARVNGTGKEGLRRVVSGKDLLRVIMEAKPSTEEEKKTLGRLTSIYAETHGRLLLYRRLDYIGCELEGGVITVACPPGHCCAAGRYLGYGMRDGVIYVQGDALEGVGEAMVGGVIRVEGRAQSLGYAQGGRIEVRELLSPPEGAPGGAVVCCGDKRSLYFQPFYHLKKLGQDADIDIPPQEVEGEAVPHKELSPVP